VRPDSIFKRNSQIELNRIYFWTATINGWKPLLCNDSYKQIIIDSLQCLSKKGKLDVFAFVIMPNHIHLIWRINELNGKESPHASFLKYTAHQFKRKLLIESKDYLSSFAVDATNKSYEFWQRDSLAIPLLSKAVAIQKLKYLHQNPLAKHWKLAKIPGEYYYSSASFYENNERSFPFLKSLWKEL
jgi:putative transposase